MHVMTTALKNSGRRQSRPRPPADELSVVAGGGPPWRPFGKGLASANMACCQRRVATLPGHCSTLWTRHSRR